MFTESLARALNMKGVPCRAPETAPTPSVTSASRDSQFSIQTDLRWTQTEAIIQISTWSLNSFSVFFNFDPAPPSFAKKGQDNSPASGAGKTGPLCSEPAFQLSIEVRDWKGAPGFGRLLACKPSSLKEPEEKKAKTLQDESLSQSIRTFGHN